MATEVYAWLDGMNIVFLHGSAKRSESEFTMAAAS